MRRCASRPLTVPGASACCATAPGHPSPWTGYANSIPNACSMKAPSAVRAGAARCSSPRSNCSTASPPWCRRRGSPPSLLRRARPPLTSARCSHRPRAGRGDCTARTNAQSIRRRTRTAAHRPLHLGAAAGAHLRSIPVAVPDLWRRNAYHRVHHERVHDTQAPRPPRRADRTTPDCARPRSATVGGGRR